MGTTLPSAEMLHAFEANAGTLRLRIEVNERQSRTHAAERDALLPKLLTGAVERARHRQTA